MRATLSARCWRAWMGARTGSPWARDLGMSETEVDVALERFGEAGFLMAAAPQGATAAKL